MEFQMARDQPGQVSSAESLKTRPKREAGSGNSSVGRDAARKVVRICGSSVDRDRRFRPSTAGRTVQRFTVEYMNLSISHKRLRVGGFRRR